MKSRAVLLCCLSGVLLFAVAFAMYGAKVAALDSKNLMRWVCDEFSTISNRIKAAVVVSLPEPLKSHVRQLLAGAASVTLVGNGVRRIPGVTAAIRAATRLTGWHDVIQLVTAKPVDKLLYAIGGIVAQALLLQLFVRPARRWAFAENQKRRRDLFTTQVGWFLLVACTAVPNGVVDAGLLIVLLARLPSETYLPALIVGKLIQPYLATALFCWPPLLQWLPSTWKAADVKVGEGEQLGAEIVVWATVATTVLVGCATFVSSLRGADDGEEELFPDDVGVEC